MDPLTEMPETIRAGTTFELLFDPALYTDKPQISDGYDFYLRLAGASVIRKKGTVDADEILFELSLAETGALVPGLYQWSITAQLDTGSPPAPSRKVEMLNGRLEVLMDLDAAAAGEALSQDERILQALKDRFEGRITLDQETIQIQGDAISRIPFDQLQALIKEYETRVAVGTDPQFFAPGNINITFNPPGVS